LEGEPRIVSKKRKQNKDTWVKNVRKIKKLRGESYTSSRGKLMPPKTFLPVVCKCFNLKMMYNLYKNDSSSPVSFYIFQEVFNKQFNLHFHAPISDSCKKCDTFNMKLKFSNDNEEKLIVLVKDCNLMELEQKEMTISRALHLIL